MLSKYLWHHVADSRGSSGAGSNRSPFLESILWENALKAGFTLSLTLRKESNVLVLQARELSSERLTPLTQVAQLASGGRGKTVTL